MVISFAYEAVVCGFKSHHGPVSSYLLLLIYITLFVVSQLIALLEKFFNVSDVTFCHKLSIFSAFRGYYKEMEKKNGENLTT